MSTWAELRRVLAIVELREPWFLLAAASALIVVALARLPRGRLRFSSLSLLPAGGASWRTRLAWVPTALLALAALCLSVAIAGPRVPERSETVRRSGIAIMMVVDVSGSMRALDLSEGDDEQTRLDAVKEVFADFVRGAGELGGRPNDAIGIVSFAGFADTRVPLTLDHDILMEVARSLEIVTSRAEDGTAIGDGLGLAVERLRQSEAESKVAILLTDGVNNAGEEDPLAAAELARTVGVKVYTIGAGTTGFAPVRVEDPFSGRPVLRQVPVEIDEATLGAIAERTGGRYFRATDADVLREVYAEIDRLERTEVTDERYRAYRDYYAHVLAVGLLLAVLAWLGRAAIWRRLP